MGRGNIPLDSNRQLPAPGDRGHYDVVLLHAGLKELGLGALEERLDDGVVPAGVDDADAQGAAIVHLGCWAFGFGEHGGGLFGRVWVKMLEWYVVVELR